MLATINGIDLLIALIGTALAWVAYERGYGYARDRFYGKGFDDGFVSGAASTAGFMHAFNEQAGRLPTRDEVYDWAKEGL